jgi:secreted trypsin-like serine protease
MTTAFDPLNKTMFLLIEACLPLCPRSSCYIYPDHQHVTLEDLTNRLLSYAGKDTCKGDSGGPLISRHGRTGKMFLKGIVSFGTTQCGNGHPGVYTNVAHYVEWIRANIKP